MGDGSGSRSCWKLASGSARRADPHPAAPPVSEVFAAARIWCAARVGRGLFDSQDRQLLRSGGCHDRMPVLLTAHDYARGWAGRRRRSGRGSCGEIKLWYHSFKHTGQSEKPCAAYNHHCVATSDQRTWIMLRKVANIYCLPGRLFALYKYYNPKLGEAVVTARWKDSPAIHAIFSTAVYGAFIVGIFAEDSPQKKTSNNATNLAETTETVEPMNLANQVSADGGSSSVRSDVSKSSLASPVVDVAQLDLSVQAVEEDEAPADESSQTEIISHIKDQPAVRAALDAAFRSGAEETWEIGKLTGRVVPSSEDPRTDCVEIRVVIDGLNQSNQPYDPAFRCKSD